jgi:hypothetical protein
VTRLAARVREAAQLGFERVGVPATQSAEASAPGVEVVALPNLQAAIERLLGEKVERPRPPTTTGREGATATAGTGAARSRG